jgi:hypothetical protein
LLTFLYISRGSAGEVRVQSTKEAGRHEQV